MPEEERGYRGHPKVLSKPHPGINWPTMRIFMPRFSSFIILVLSLAISRTILTIKHLEVQLQDLPAYYGLNQDTNIVNYGW